MSWFSKKSSGPPIEFKPDFSNASLSGSELARQLDEAQAQASYAIQASVESAKGSFWWVWRILLPLALVALGIVIYDWLAPPEWTHVFFNRQLVSPYQAPTNPPVTSAGPPATQAQPPPVLKRVWASIFGNSSGNLAPPFHDASQESIIQGTLAPLSAEREGGYGMQWWMYVKDWNYGYGKKKGVVRRPDSSNKAVMNPEVSLHPTDNSLQVSVSVYPSSEGGSGKAEPAPAGHSGSSDDVFVCEVPNIPLQTWFSVSVTVFGRNLDIYIDGKLVKSCFLSGVPKPAVGDIQLTPDGGFSGRVCNFYHYPKMLTPSDAMLFWSSGTSCMNQTPTGGTAAATGYSVKFGVYDALGKEVQEYAF